jgi:tetratricopeptide (TPR) repeat protein
MLLTSCSPTLFSGDLSDYQDDIQELQRRLIENPSDADALRDLGAIYLRARQFSEANTYLEQAFAYRPDDPKTLFNLGLANETLARRDTALRLYEKFAEVPRSSPYRSLMEGRYEWLSRRILRDEVEQLALQEPLQTDSTSPRIVAVFPFTYAGADERFEPLSRGLADLVSVDLENVNTLRVVERVRLQALLDELQLAQHQYMDDATAPRLGRLLGAGRLISGQYNVLGRDNLRLDGAYMQIEDASYFQLDSQSDVLRNLFVMEKALVFNLVNQLGIELTPQEREQIEFIPTQNLQAFLAYSRGLQEEDAGAYGLAAGFYRQASQLDPGFALAANRAEKADAMAATDMSTEELITEAASAESGGNTGIDLMGLRVGLLNQAIGAGFLPGEESREPASESAGETVLLPTPPAPPNPQP